MKTITIIEGITLTASVATLNAYLIEKADIEAERLEHEEELELLRWLANPANRAHPLYSDIYKDVHGFHPHQRGRKLLFGSSRPAGATRIRYKISQPKNPKEKRSKQNKKAPSRNRATLIFASAGGISPPWMYGMGRGRGIHPHQSPPEASEQLFAVPCETHPQRAPHTFSVVVRARLAPLSCSGRRGSGDDLNVSSTCVAC